MHSGHPTPIPGCTRHIGCAGIFQMHAEIQYTEERDSPWQWVQNRITAGTLSASSARVAPAVQLHHTQQQAANCMKALGPSNTCSSPLQANVLAFSHTPHRPWPYNTCMGSSSVAYKHSSSNQWMQDPVWFLLNRLPAAGHPHPARICHCMLKIIHFLQCCSPPHQRLQPSHTTRRQQVVPQQPWQQQASHHCCLRCNAGMQQLVGKQAPNPTVCLKHV